MESILIILIEPISKNIGMYVPAYPLPILEIASFVKANIPETEIQVISIPMDYGLPLSPGGRDHVYGELINDLSEMKPKAVGISCTAIVQAEETIHLCEKIKETDPDIFLFLGGYFPTIYYEEIFSRTSAVDLIVVGEGEVSTLEIVKKLERGEDPRGENIPNLVWKQDGNICFSKLGIRFNLREKAILNLELLRRPKAYNILPYSFSRGCPYKCNFCMEEYIRPIRKGVSARIIKSDLINLSQNCNTHNVAVCDALFKSFDLIPLVRSLGIKLNFETRCDLLQPRIIPDLAEVCNMLVLGFESASYNTLRRMNKVRDRAHYEKYLHNTMAIFREAIKSEIPIMIFLIAGYPGDTEEDLETSLFFIRELSKYKGLGGHIFNIGECRIYLKTKMHDLALSLPDVIFDNDGIFGNNVVRQPSKNLHFETILNYMREVYDLSNITPKIRKVIHEIMPFFRLPAHALYNEMIPESCFKGEGREIFIVHRENLATFKKVLPILIKENYEWMAGQRSSRNLPF